MRRVVVFILLLSTILAGCAGKEAVRRAVRENPEIVMDVLREHRLELLQIMQEAVTDKEAMARRQQWLLELAEPFKPVIEGDRPIRGSVIAPVTVVEYSDFFCPYCDRGSRTLHELQDLHPEVIKVVFKHFPLHEGSQLLAGLFEGVALQNEDAAWEFKRRVFAARATIQEEGPSGPTLRDILEDLGVDIKQAYAAARSASVQERIAADVQEARTFGFRGTPTYLIGGVAIRGAAPLQEFEEVLDLVLKDRDGAATCIECGSE